MHSHVARKVLLAALAVLLAVTFCATSLAAEKLKKLHGKLSAIDVDAGAVVMETQKGDISFLYDDDTVFLLGKKPVEPGEDLVGLDARFSYAETDETVTLRVVRLSPPGYRAYTLPRASKGKPSKKK